MALEAQRDDIVENADRANRQLDDAYHHLIDGYHALDYAMRGLPDQVQRTLVSTAYDITVQAKALTEQLMLLRGIEPSER